ncbi:MAG: isoleucine--tRNA ligase [bacterium]
MGKPEFKILLPKTSFSMKANLKEKEPEIQKFWRKIDIYNLILEKNSQKPAFILHDGPPYANGHIHMGHALNKILKDILVKYKNISGWAAPFVPGWDCHGLPIEYQLFKELGVKKSEIPQIEFREKAVAFVKNYLNIQMREFIRLGIFADWKRPYLTMQKSYEAAILETFAELVEKKFIYRGEKPIHWCPSCETALAEAEVEYKDITSPSIYVLFECRDMKGVSALVWTTTPWTLPANAALAFNDNFLYSVISANVNGRQLRLLTVDEKAGEVLEKIGAADYKIISQNKGSHFAGMKFKHPFLEKKSVGITADFVEKQEGTGIVHIAPGHGEDDYRAGLKYGLPIFSPVDEKGVFTGDAGLLKDEFVFKADEKIIELLEKKGTLLKSEKITHSYPHCWRCKKPIIFRATPQWFISIDRNGLRKKLLDEIARVEWVPEDGLKRITSMVEYRPDWCISRQRLWGVPIPVFYCKKCGKPLLDAKIIRRLATLVRAAGSEILLKDKLPLELKCSCESSDFRRENDILDVWFDSGVSHHILREREGHKYPADAYLEGSDQHRGWFQTSLILACITTGDAPYRTVLTHGFVVDGTGQKMSKSVGNVITPQEIIDKSGADILRLWVASQDYSADMRISDEIIKSCVESYRKIRNTFRFLLGNLRGWNPQMEIEFEKMKEVDRWILIRLEETKKKVTADYEAYNFSSAFHRIFLFMNSELSSFYLDILKDRLYTLGESWRERKSAQTALWHLLKNLVILLGPILSHTAEEIWATVNREIITLSKSVFPEEIPCEKFFETAEWKNKWAFLMKVREIALKAIEIAREKGEIGNPLEAGVWVKTSSAEEQNILAEFNKEDLKEMLLVSEIRMPEENEIISSHRQNDIEVSVFAAGGEKCKRCWRKTKDTKDGLCKRCRDVLGIS